MHFIFHLKKEYPRTREINRRLIRLIELIGRKIITIDGIDASLWLANEKVPFKRGGRRIKFTSSIFHRPFSQSLISAFSHWASR